MIIIIFQAATCFHTTSSAKKLIPITREKKHNPPTCFLEIEDFLRMCRFAPVFHTLLLYLPPLSDAFSRKMNEPMLEGSPV